ncbi:MAG: hypothetical protein KF805_09805 [Phycisphaeraceae bacterium]|nr:hypothetical protein [Phycisphaeraceae bacterium]
MRYADLVAALAAAAGSTLALAQFSGFERLNTAGSTLRSINPTDLNADGSVVVGYGYSLESFIIYRPFRRVSGNAVEEIGLYPGENRARAYAVNANGAFIVGGGDSQGFWWVPPGPNIGSETPPLLDVNDDGSVFISETTLYEGLGSPSSFPNIPSYTSLKAVRLNAAGDMAALTCNFFQPGNGYGYPPDPPINIDQAARWTAGGGTQGLGFLPSGDSSHAIGISADGAVVVGRANIEQSPGAFVERPFRWNALEGMQPIPMLPGISSFGEAVDASADGAIIVGNSDNRAFIWDAAHGTRDLKQVLTSNGNDLTGWTLFSADAISDDGLVVAGFGTDPSGNFEGWIANLAITCTPPQSVGTVTLDVIASEGGPATGTPQVFGSFFTPSDLTAAGTVVFNASLANGMQSCYTGVPSTLSLIALANGAPYFEPLLLRVTASGHAALRDTRQYFPGPVGKYVYYSGPSSSLAVLAESGAAAPDTGGGTFDPQFSNSSNPFLNNNDLYAFQSQVSGGTTGVAAFATVGGVLTRSFVSLPPGITSLANPTLIALTDSGALVRRGNLGDGAGPESILIGGPPPAVAQIVASTGMQVPGESPGVIFTDLLDAAAQDNSVAFFAQTSSGSPVFCKGTTSAIEMVAKIGSVVDSNPALTIQGFSSSKGFALLPDGDTLFVANLTDPIETTRTALVRSSASGLRTLVLGGTTKLPGYDVCRVVKDLFFFSADGDRALISATPTLAAEQGMYLLTDGGLTRLAQVGQTIDLAPGVAGPISQIIPPPFSAAARTGRDGRGTFLNGNAAVFGAAVNTGPSGFKRALLRVAFQIPGSCPGDLNSDGLVDDSDFTIFVVAYNILDCADPDMPPGCPADLNQDGVVEDTDFTIFVAAYNELLCP